MPPKHKSTTISTKPRGGLNRPGPGGPVTVPRQLRQVEVSPIRQEKSPPNANVAINKLPVEVLVAIILLAIKNSRPKSRYPCIQFSRVCRYWRLAVLGNAVFWKVIVFDESMTSTHTSRDVLQELLRRSQTAPLEIVVHSNMKSSYAFWGGLYADANRVKTLFMNRGLAHCFLDLVSFFPSLENIFYPPYSVMKSIDSESRFESFCQPTNLTALRISLGTLECFAIPTWFPELRWLDIGYKSSNLVTLLKFLQNLSNLQFLHIYSSVFHDWDHTPSNIVTFPELKVLLLQPSLAPSFINAPNLTYLDIDGYLSKYGTDNFCGFDFSRITRIRFQCVKSYEYCITGYNNSQASFLLDCGDIQSTYNPIVSSYANQFRLRVEDSDDDSDDDEGNTLEHVHGPRTPFHLFATYLSKTTNLVEINFGVGGLGRHCHYSNHIELSAFFTAVKATTTVREFAVTWGCSFARLCDILSDSTIFPRLEKITWVGSRSETLSDLRPFQELMKERFVTGQKPLTVELPNFPVTSELVEEIKRLGIRLCFTQKKDN